jgi:hypothetical protein
MSSLEEEMRNKMFGTGEDRNRPSSSDGRLKSGGFDKKLAFNVTIIDKTFL